MSDYRTQSDLVQWLRNLEAKVSSLATKLSGLVGVDTDGRGLRIAGHHVRWGPVNLAFAAATVTTTAVAHGLDGTPVAVQVTGSSVVTLVGAQLLTSSQFTAFGQFTDGTPRTANVTAWWVAIR